MEKGKSLPTGFFRGLQVAFVLIAVAFIVIGVFRGEVGIVLKKAVRICMECVGLG